MTDNGGLLSHSAIVAREYGIPGVVGTREATERIADGALRARRRHRRRGHGARMTDLLPLAEASDTSLFGSKAVGLGDAIRDGLPVPPGYALSRCGGRGGRRRRTKRRSHGSRRRWPRCPTPLAVRSSAVDEDGKDASFAGQHLTLLNVSSVDDVPAALREIWWSANSDSAITYRQRVGLFTRPSVGVVVQSLLDPVAAGVMFTENPVTGADERVIEASWGLGEAVVAGLVIPDTFRVGPRRHGARADTRPQAHRDPDAAQRRHLRRGGAEGAHRSALPHRRTRSRSSHALATRCEEVYGKARDIEWALADGTLFLLQCRAVTTSTRQKATIDPMLTVAENDPAELVPEVPLFAGLERRRGRGRSRALFKARRFAAGDDR